MISTRFRSSGFLSRSCPFSLHGPCNKPFLALNSHWLVWPHCSSGIQTCVQQHDHIPKVLHSWLLPLSLSVLISHHYPLAHWATAQLGETHQILSELRVYITAIPLLEMLSPWLIPFHPLVFSSNVTSSKSSTPTPTPPPASKKSLSISIWNYV